MSLARFQDDLLVGVDASRAGAPGRRACSCFRCSGSCGAARSSRICARGCGPFSFSVRRSGAVGWWMVASGLSDRVSVSQYRLAFHLTLACVIFAAVLWTAQNLVPRAPIAAPARIRASAMALLASRDRADLSRRAGLRAARRPDLQHLAADRRQPGAGGRAPVFPGAVRGAIFSRTRSRCSSIIACWPMRCGSFALLHAADVARTLRGGPALTAALALAAAVTLQAALGIVTLVHQAPLALALLHQADGDRGAGDRSGARGAPRARAPARVAEVTGGRRHAPRRAGDVIETQRARRRGGPAHGGRQGQRHEHRILRRGDGAVRTSYRRRAPWC